MECEPSNFTRIKCVEGYFDVNGFIIFECSLCGRITELTDLISHIKSHFIDSPYQCYKCKETFCGINVFMNHSCCPTPIKVDNIKSISVPSIYTETEKSTIIQDDLTDSFAYDNKDISTKTEIKSSHYGLSFTSPSPTPIIDNITYPKMLEMSPLQLISPKSPPSSPSRESSPPIMPTEKTIPSSKRIHPMVQCEYCGLILRAGSLKCHYIQHKHAAVKHSEYKCDICGKIFKLLRYIKGHMTIHIDEKPFSCKICGSRFRIKGQLNQHEKIHKEAAYSCIFCIKKFVDKKGLRKHHLVHTGEKPFKCDLCDVFFRTPSARRVHRRLHTGEKPYQCNICGKTFTQIGSLKFHSKSHVKKEENL